MRAAKRIPVPVAESQFKRKTASSGLVGLSEVGGGTTGGVRRTELCRPATANEGAESLSNDCFTLGTPQMKTRMLSKTQGIQAARIFATGCVSADGVGSATPVRNSSRGFHTRSKRT